jgi:leucyl aminopeptidase
LDGALAALAADAEFTGALGSTLVVPTLGRVPAKRLVLVGVGEADALDARSIRRALAVAVRQATEEGARDIVSPLPPTSVSEGIASAAEAVQLATYRFTRYFGTLRKAEAGRAEGRVRFLGDFTEDEVEDAFARARAVAASVSLARDLVAEPPSTLTPATMVEHAQRVAGEAGLELSVLGPADFERIGAGAMLAVGKGSAVEPRLIHLVYRPEGEAEGEPVGLVGKCITFDTGGYSLKTHDGMVTMKSDMGGGAAVLGTMAALRALGCRREVHGVICAAENMISGVAFRPDDVLTAMNGVTIEVISTDAEGRLVLADGLVYTARQGVSELIDLATLTGAAEVALGDTTALFVSDDRLAEDLLAAAARSGERTWRMPLVDEYTERLKSDVADLKNTGGRAAGAIIAALFLKHFTEGLPWAHFDIAGSALAEKSDGDVPKGPTGTGVRTLLAYLTRSTDGQ